MAEWSNAPDSKSGVRFYRTVGSNPTLSAKLLRVRSDIEDHGNIANHGDISLPHGKTVWRWILDWILEWRGPPIGDAEDSDPEGRRSGPRTRKQLLAVAATIVVVGCSALAGYELGGMQAFRRIAATLGVSHSAAPADQRH